ncbi:MAG: hypothetical protein MR419_05000 [Clostridiales bacterium]|nr:hypothetical protein [Clostridiales bacterium]MDY4171640.1 hypothetical protein [Evtepia sp.]
MIFQDNICTTYSCAVPLEQRQVPSFHDYSSAESYLTFLKGQIRAQLQANPAGCHHATGHTTLEGGSEDEAKRDPSSCLLLIDGVYPELADPGFVRQYLGILVTKKGYVFLHDLQELASKEGISLSFSLEYQNQLLPLPLDPQTLQRRFLILHNPTPGELIPKVRISYDYQVA